MRAVRKNVIEAADTTVLSVTTFCTFVREFALLGLHAGRVEEGTSSVGDGARAGRFSSRHGYAHAASGH